MLRPSQIRGAMRIHDMIERSKWQAIYGKPHYLSDADREYASWFPIRPRGVWEGSRACPNCDAPPGQQHGSTCPRGVQTCGEVKHG